MMKIIAILFGIVLVFPIGIAYGSMSVKKFCDPDTRDFDRKVDYFEEVSDTNVKLKTYLSFHLDATMQVKADLIIKPRLEEIGQKAECLKQIEGKNPDDIIQFSPEVKEVFVENYDLLVKIAPTLVEYATVPEFQEMVVMVLASSVVLVIILARKFHIEK